MHALSIEMDLYALQHNIKLADCKFTLHASAYALSWLITLQHACIKLASALTMQPGTFTANYYDLIFSMHAFGCFVNTRTV